MVAERQRVDRVRDIELVVRKRDQLQKVNGAAASLVRSSPRRDVEVPGRRFHVNRAVDAAAFLVLQALFLQRKRLFTLLDRFGVEAPAFLLVRQPHLQARIAALVLLSRAVAISAGAS